MKNLFIIVFICINFLQADYLSLKYKKIKKIDIATISINDFDFKEKNKRKSVLKRIEDYQRLLKKVKSLSENKKILMVNYFFNKFKYKSDYINYNKKDHWANIKEFFFNGSGDCEDYAIAKYITLLSLGIKKEKITLFVSKYKSTRHMVIVYKKTKNSKKYILDNVTNQILSLENRRKLRLISKIS